LALPLHLWQRRRSQIYWQQVISEPEKRIKYNFSIKIPLLDLHQFKALASIDQHAHIEASGTLKGVQNL
jgi:hypothetical protein